MADYHQVLKEYKEEDIAKLDKEIARSTKPARIKFLKQRKASIQQQMAKHIQNRPE